MSSSFFEHIPETQTNTYWHNGESKTIVYVREDKFNKTKEALEVAKAALSKPRKECAACSGSGRYETVTNYFGEEVTTTEHCECAVDKGALAEIEKIMGQK